MNVDVILPTYNGERWVGEAIDSVLAQSYPNWHLTIIDDASQDGTAARVEAARSRHPDRISVTCSQANLHAAAERMAAIRQTQGELIAFLDQDDRWLPNKLERQVARLRAEPRVEAAHTDVENIDAAGDLLPGKADVENEHRRAIPYDRLEADALMRSLACNLSIRIATSMFTREAFLAAGGYDERLFGGEDLEFWVRFASRFRTAHLAEVLVQRRIHPGNSSTRYHRARMRGKIKAMESILRQFPQLAPEITASRRKLLRQNLKRSLKQRDLQDALFFGWNYVLAAL